MTATDDFSKHAASVDGPARHAAAVTPHDTNTLDHVSRGLYVGAAGNVVVITASGETVTFVAVPAGAVLPLQVTTVKATGTTASSIVSLW